MRFRLLALILFGLIFISTFQSVIALSDDGVHRQETRLVSISAGQYHTCGLKTDGTLACWGRTNEGQSSPPGDTFTQVIPGVPQTVGLKTDGTLAYWGDTTYGQSNPLPTGTFTQISAGTYHSCAVKTDGTVVCWGYNGQGQTNAPTGTFTQVSAG